MTTPFEGLDFLINPTSAAERNQALAGLKNGLVAIAHESGAG
jgi:hypothetical protein